MVFHFSFIKKINQMDALSDWFTPHRNGILIDLCVPHDDKIDYFIAFENFQDKSVFL